jgi:hypothetical protein
MVADVPATGHNRPGVRRQFLHGAGPLDRGGQRETGPVREPWYAAVGPPITEPPWTRAKAGGRRRDVLVQVFERRALADRPANPPSFQVEMGNVGRRDVAGRYGR